MFSTVSHFVTYDKRKRDSLSVLCHNAYPRTWKYFSAVASLSCELYPFDGVASYNGPLWSMCPPRLQTFSRSLYSCMTATLCGCLSKHLFTVLFRVICIQQIIFMSFCAPSHRILVTPLNPFCSWCADALLAALLANIMHCFVFAFDTCNQKRCNIM